MELIVLGSSSAGNCYILNVEKEALVIEAGVRFSEVKQALNFDISKIAGCVITHAHNDHSKYINDFLKVGIKTLAPSHTFESKAINSHFAKPINHGTGYRVGGFSVIPFNVVHDVPCVCYVIDHAEMGRLLFVTDTMFLEYQFSGINHFIIEANYSDAIAQKRVLTGSLNASVMKRTYDSHMEFETTKSILSSNDLSKCVNIVLIHLSDGNSDESLFIKECQQLTGIPTNVAKKGLKIQLIKTPF
jgi:phosphoribosyl 1,2-cyclic phosphodiesterase